MPFAKNSNEMPCSDSFTDRNNLMIVWAIPNDPAQTKSKSVELIRALFDNEGKGSLFQALKSLNYIQSQMSDIPNGIQTPFKMISVEFELSDTGIQNYQKVIAIIFEYLNIVKLQWLKGG